MKKLIIHLLALICVTIGNIGYGFFYSLENNNLILKYPFLFLGIIFCFIPATNSWVKFFKETFNKDK